MKKILPAGMLTIALLITKAQAFELTYIDPVKPYHLLKATAIEVVWKENGTGKSNEWILFSKEFSNALNGKQPVIVVTPVCGNEGFSIHELTDKGFMVKGNKNKAEYPLRFNWQAELPAKQDN